MHEELTEFEKMLLVKLIDNFSETIDFIDYSKQAEIYGINRNDLFNLKCKLGIEDY